MCLVVMIAVAIGLGVEVHFLEVVHLGVGMTNKEPLICPNCKCEVPKKMNAVELRMEILNIIGIPTNEPRRATISKDEAEAIYEYIKPKPKIGRYRQLKGSK